MFPCQKHGCPGHRSVMLAHNCIEVGNCSRVHNERSWIKAGNQQQITFHYAKPTQLPRAKSGPPYRRQVVHPRPPTSQGRSGAEPGAPLLIILRLVCICDMHAHLNVNTRHTLLHFDIERPRKNVLLSPMISTMCVIVQPIDTIVFKYLQCVMYDIGRRCHVLYE